MTKINKYAQEAANSRNSKKEFKRKPLIQKKEEKVSIKKQMERQYQPLPRTVEEWGNHRGLIEYQMPKEMAADILTQRMGRDKNIDPQKYLCDIVNTEMNLLGYCVRVVVTA